jgi:hypothetical protein
MDDCVLSRVLIVAPKLVAQQGWPLQWQLWGHVQHLASEVRVIGFEDLGLWRPAGVIRLDFKDKRATKSHLLSLRERIHVCSWDAFPWLAKAYGKNWPYDGVVFDESSFLRDQQSERGKAARHAVHRTGVVEHVLELTATADRLSASARHLEQTVARFKLQMGEASASFEPAMASSSRPKRQARPSPAPTPRPAASAGGFSELPAAPFPSSPSKDAADGFQEF